MKIRYPEHLPVSQVRDEIAAAIRAHQVVVLAGETGSGKTTQLPKILLELGRERIGHTQPRRIAARAVAERVAEELETELGDVVGYDVRGRGLAGDREGPGVARGTGSGDSPLWCGRGGARGGEPRRRDQNGGR